LPKVTRWSPVVRVMAAQSDNPTSWSWSPKWSIDVSMIETLVAECDRIRLDSLYTAQTHFFMAQRTERFPRVALLIVPAFIAGICGMLTALNFPSWLGAISAAAGLVSGVTGAIGLDFRSSAHAQSGNAYTVLRHDAQFLKTISAYEDPAHVANEVKILHRRYEELCRSAPLTNAKAYKKAEERIKRDRLADEVHRDYS
jgi:hypothetical protein